MSGDAAGVSDAWAEKSLRALNSGDEVSLAQQLRALPPDVLAQAVQVAHELGNKAFKEKQYNEAIYQYTSTLTGDPGRVAAWSNRAACFSATNQHDRALKDAETCVQLSPDWPKGHYRLGRALLGIGGSRCADACQAFAKGCALDPKSKEMRKWHKVAHAAWQEHAKTTGATVKRRTFDTKEFDKMVKEHEDEEARVAAAIAQEEEAKNMEFERPDGTKMSREEMEAMLSGQDPNAGPRGSEYKPSFDPALLSRVGESTEPGRSFSAAHEVKIVPEDSDFKAAQEFSGARDGFVFKTGAYGTGYYCDRGLSETELAGAGAVDTESTSDGGAPKDPHDDPVLQQALGALRSYMQDLSELQVPRWQIHALGDTELLTAYSCTIASIHAQGPAGQRWLHLGVGTGFPLMKTISLCGIPDDVSSAAINGSSTVSMAELLERVGLPEHLALFEEEEMTDIGVLLQMLARPEQLRAALKELGVSKMGNRERIIAALKEEAATASENGVKAAKGVTVHACTGRDAPYLFSAAHRLLTHNSLRNGVQLLHRSFETLDTSLGSESDLATLGIGDIRRGSVFEQARRDTLPARADVCVIDPEWVDEGLIGKRLLPILAHAKRALLVPGAVIVPARAALWAQLLQVQCPTKASSGLDLTHLDTYRWAPCYETFRLSEQPEGTCQLCSAPAQVLSFDFQALSPEALLAGGVGECTLSGSAHGMANAVLFWFEMEVGQGTVVSTSPAETSSKNRRVWGQALQWLAPPDSPVAVNPGKPFTLSAKHSATRIKFSVTENAKSEDADGNVEQQNQVIKQFNRGFRGHRAQWSSASRSGTEVLIQCDTDGIHFFAADDANELVETMTLNAIQKWRCETDEDGDASLILDVRINAIEGKESKGLTECVELECPGAATICTFLDEQKQRDTADDTEQPAEAEKQEAQPIQGTLPRWYYDLIADQDRCDAYDSAIKSQLSLMIAKRKREQTQEWWTESNVKGKVGQQAIRPGKNHGRLVEVLNLGCGAGLMPMLTVRAAKEQNEARAVHVTGVDNNGVLLRGAVEIATSNKLGNSSELTLVHKDSRTCSVGATMGGVTPELIRRADICVLENFVSTSSLAWPRACMSMLISTICCSMNLQDYGLLGEGLLPTLHHAFAVLLKPDAIVVPAIACVWAVVLEARPEGFPSWDGGKTPARREFNADLWRTYRYSPEYVGVNVDNEIRSGRMRALTEPFQVGAYDLAEVTKPQEPTRAERQDALSRCEATAQPEYEPDAPDPDNVWGELKSSLAQEAVTKGDPAFLDGELIHAYQRYKEANQMEPLNRPTQLRLKAVERFLGFPCATRTAFKPAVTVDGIANTVAFWFELQMEKEQSQQTKSSVGADNHETDDEDEDADSQAYPRQIMKNDSPEVLPKRKIKTITTAPACFARGEINRPRRGQHWMQATQVLEEIKVSQGEVLPIEAILMDGGTELKFQVLKNEVAAPTYAPRRTSVPPVDPLWVRAQQEVTAKMKKIEQMVISSAEGHKQASMAAAMIAVDPGAEGAHGIDPQRANAFALSFHSQ